MVEIILIIILGVLTGVFTGLTPVIHPNIVIFGSLPFYFSLDIGFVPYMVFISGLSVAHTFHDFLPAIFLGAPETEAALSTVFGTEIASRGKGWRRSTTWL